VVLVGNPQKRIGLSLIKRKTMTVFRKPLTCSMPLKGRSESHIIRHMGLGEHQCKKMDVRIPRSRLHRYKR
jgi:hypothetical protein